MQALPSKRPRREVKPTVEPSRPAKRVKRLARKGEREIHVISSQTTGATTPSVSPSPPVAQALVENQPIPTEEAVQPRPVSKVRKPVIVPLVEVASILEKAVPPTEKTSSVKPSVVVLKESEGSDEVPLASRPRSHRRLPPVSEAAVQVGLTTVDHSKPPAEEPATAMEAPIHLQNQDLNSMFEAAVRVGLSTADHGKRPVGEPEASAETPVHPQDQISIFLRRRLLRPL
ncbi:hypothetical protein ACFXTN_042985 [Malus domestica]